MHQVTTLHQGSLSRFEHSDPDRLVWCRDHLRASVREHGHQIIVITSRPLDYLSPEEMPDTPSVIFESEDGLLTAVDLRRVIIPHFPSSNPSIPWELQKL